MTTRILVAQEIEELHTFFEGWLDGTLPANEEAFKRLTSVLDTQFTLITPAGEEVQYAELLATLKEGHGSRPQFRLWVENIQLLYRQSPLVLASYEECQDGSNGFNRRLSTAVFREDAGASNGLVWLRVHETWIS